MASLLSKGAPRPSSALTLRRTVSSLALLAGSFGLASLATPAAAQCVEAPANVYTCSEVCGSQTFPMAAKRHQRTERRFNLFLTTDRIVFAILKYRSEPGRL